MLSYSICEFALSNEELTQYYTDAKANYPLENFGDLDLIFSVALANRDRFPSINLTGIRNPRTYLERWVKGYYDAVHNLPSTRIATPKTACTDPAIRVIVQATQGLSEQEAETGEVNHNLFMSAENIQGNLLEEYIALKTRAYGFLWCDGNVLRAVDFCNTTGSLLLQIKNKSNTENSSSSNIREGTTIEKWFRLGTSTRGGVRFPSYRWDRLNTLINQNRTEGFNLPAPTMNELDYQQFLNRIATLNPNLITNH